MTFDYLKDPGEITRLSFKIIRDEVDLGSLPDDLAGVAVRLVHACAIPDIIHDLAFSEDAAKAGRMAFQNAKPVFCDAEMVAQGITHSRLPADNEVICTLNTPGTREQAAATGTTRSAAALEHWRARLDGSVVAIGNAPTALFRLLEIIEEENLRPAIILGFPVGFVGAAELKEALVETAGKKDIPFITLMGRRGGSALASAAVNALACEEPFAEGKLP